MELIERTITPDPDDPVEHLEARIRLSPAEAHRYRHGTAADRDALRRLARQIARCQDPYSFGLGQSYAGRIYMHTSADDRSLLIVFQTAGIEV